MHGNSILDDLTKLLRFQQSDLVAKKGDLCKWHDSIYVVNEENTCFSQ